VTVRAQILELLADLQRKFGMAVLLITHDLNLVRHFAERVAVMENGRIVEQGPVGQVFGAPQDPYTRRLIESRPVRDLTGDHDRDASSIVHARALRVVYPVPRPGLSGWFRKNEFVAVQAADFDIAPGRTLGVVGESGSGKSTLALAALGLLKHGGELQIDGRQWGSGSASDRSLRQLMQVVFQDPFSSLSPRMTVEQIVGEGLRVHEPGLDVAQRRVRAIAALRDVGLTEAQFPSLLERYPHEFSGGQRQRIAIARALITRPRLIVADEPVSALDVSVQAQVLNLMQDLQQKFGISYLLISHDLAVVNHLCDEVCVLHRGVVVERGEARQLFTHAQHPYTQALLAAVPLAEPAPMPLT
ncbi:MAG: ATP-binding cassette domain-containing protein, partial [Gammaproteobacteria bacterium]|nr:ATP-binding cassette domain-containing protein [Gammaproteobacteria bacterium]